MSARRPMFALAVARRLYRACLWLLPRQVRTTYRAELIETFASASDDAATVGAMAVWRLLAREVRDLGGARRANDAPPFQGHQRGESRMSMPVSMFSHWRQTWRSLSQRPAFFIAAVATLGFGAGTTTAVFSLIDTVVIKPLPYPNADQLVALYESSPAARDKTSLIAPPRLDDWGRLNATFVAVAGNYAENVTDTSGESPERLEGRRVTARFFDVYATPPLAGRTFTSDEERAGGPAAAVISDALWQRRFGGERAALGRALTIGGRPYTIVGVMPATFTSGTIDVWLPAQIGPGFSRDARFLSGVGRMRSGVTLEMAAQDLVAVQAALGREFPPTDAGWSVDMKSLKSRRLGDAERPLLMVFAAVVLLWMIAVANVAGLTLVQVQRRGRELAVRAALGASRVQSIGVLAREGALVAIAGGVVALGAAFGFVALMRALLVSTPRINELALDWRAFAFTAGTSALAAFACGIVPALAATRPGLASAMAVRSRGVTDTRHRLQRSLVVAQVALSVLLVGSATGLLQSYYSLSHATTGFDADGVVTFHVGARWDEDRVRIGQLQTRLLETLRARPDVQAAGFTNFLPATGATLRYQVKVDGLNGPDRGGAITVGTRMITRGYLNAIRVPLVAGAWCPDPKPDLNAPRSALVNQQFVSTYAQGINLVGRTLEIVQASTAPITIAGVVGNVAEDGFGASAMPYVYSCDPLGSWPDPEYVVRTTDAAGLTAALRTAVKDIDPSRAVFGIRAVSDVLDGSLQAPRLDAGMLTLFAIAAMMLAAIGLYSLFMLIVSERGRDIAVRLALGAAPRQMLRLVIGGAGRLLCLGVVAGVALTALADRWLAAIFAGLRPLSPASLAVAVASLALVALAAVAIPAIRASRIAPIQALRGE